MSVCLDLEVFRIKNLSIFWTGWIVHVTWIQRSPFWRRNTKNVTNEMHSCEIWIVTPVFLSPLRVRVACRPCFYLCYMFDNADGEVCTRLQLLSSQHYPSPSVSDNVWKYSLKSDFEPKLYFQYILPHKFPVYIFYQITFFELYLDNLDGQGTYIVASVCSQHNPGVWYSAQV